MKKLYVNIILIALVALSFMSCKDFQGEQFNAPAREKQAIAVLQDTTGREVTAVAAAIYDTAWTDQNIANHVMALYDTLVTEKNIISVSDSGYIVHIPATVDTSYLAVKSSSAAGIVVYASDYIRARVLNKDKSIVDPSDVDIPQVTIAESISLVDASTVTYSLKSRIALGTTQTEYILQIIKPEQKNTAAGALRTIFRMAVFNN